jgi:hypothetical protein
MITGVLFLDPEKNISFEKILKKYVLRIILAIIIFGIPYCFMEIFFDANMLFNSCYARAPLSPMLKADRNSIAFLSEAMYICAFTAK